MMDGVLRKFHQQSKQAEVCQCTCEVNIFRALQHFEKEDSSDALDGNENGHGGTGRQSI